MTNEVARWTRTVVPAAELAEQIAATEFVPKAMRGNVPAVAACIMYGDEIGVGPMTALQGVHVIDGRPFVSAELMRALVLGAGHHMRVRESSGTRCIVQGARAGAKHDSEWQTVEWTIEMARAAGLLSKAGSGWHKYPRAMLLARASADLCRMAFPDVVRGLGHVPETPDAADVSDWAEYAESLGPEPEAPALPATEQIQWSPRFMSDDRPHDTPANRREAEWEAAEESREDTPQAEDPKARLVDEAGIKRIMAAYGDLPYGPDRQTRLALFSAIVGRPLETTKDLERMEAYRLLGGIGDLRTGRTIATDDGHGGFTIHAGTEPDEPEEWP